MMSRRTTTLVATGIAIVIAIVAPTGMIVHRNNLNGSLKSAVIRGDVSSTTRLLAAGADPNMTIPLRLHMPNSLASARFTWEMFRDSQSRPLTLLAAAASRPYNGAIIDVLIDHGADPNGGITALFEAVPFGNASNVKVLLEHGAQLHTGTARLDPGPACIAAMSASSHYPNLRGEKDFVGVIQLLLDHGLDVNCTDNLNKTLLMSAAETGDTKAVDYLVKHNADPSRKDANGLTARNYAYASPRRAAVLKILDSYDEVDTHAKKTPTARP